MNALLEVQESGHSSVLFQKNTQNIYFTKLLQPSFNNLV